jgi:hypothetical protein
MNAVWVELVLIAQELLAWTKRLCLTGQAARWDPKRLRHRLEEVEGKRALEWVEARNAATVAELSRSPVYQPILERTKQILDARDRIPFPSIIGDACTTSGRMPPTRAGSGAAPAGTPT